MYAGPGWVGAETYIILGPKCVSQDGNKDQRRQKRDNIARQHWITSQRPCQLIHEAKSANRDGGVGWNKGVTTYFAPVLATDRSPPCFFAVTSQAINEQTRPRIGESAAAARFCLLHIKVSVAGTTAEDMITPYNEISCTEGAGKGLEVTIIRYKYPIDIPASA